MQTAAHTIGGTTTKEVRRPGDTTTKSASHVERGAIGEGTAPAKIGNNVRISKDRKALEVKYNNFSGYSQNVCEDRIKGNKAKELFIQETTGVQDEQVKGNLKRHLRYWEEIGVNDTVWDIIKNGYKIPLKTVPPSQFFKKQ